MRHGSFQGRRNNNNNRFRGNNGQQGGGQHRQQHQGNQRPHRNQVFDSNGPETRVRGTAFQINEKYLGLAKDAYSAGDLVLAENYYQHADHYQRIINEFEPQVQPASHQPRHDEQGDVDQPQQPSPDMQESADAPQDDQPPRRSAPVRRERMRRPEAAPQDSDNQGADQDADLGLPSSIFKTPDTV